MIRVLIADDQRINRVLLKRCLDKTRYDVVEAENGREALEKFEAERPDVVLMDVMMPEMNGFEAARAMKDRLGPDHVPIIMVTSLSDEASLSQGMEAGADDFIPKPFNALVLESKMKAALRTRQAFRSLDSKRQELQALHEQSHDEQVMAEKLMASVLQTEALRNPMFKFRTEPMDVFNGDFLMAGRGPRGKTRVMLGDFAGHGLAAAIGGLPVAVDFERLCASGASIFDIACAANDELRKVLPRDRFMAAVLLDVDPIGGEVEVINAGMPTVLVRGKGGGLRTRVDSTHLPLGILTDFEGKDSVLRLPLEDGDRLYLYSDGITEGLNPSGEVFGEERFEALLADHPDDGGTFEALLADFDSFVDDAPADDDVTLMEVYPGAWREHDETPASEGTARLAVELNADLIRTVDVMQLLQGMLEGVGALEGRRAEIFAVLAELVNNAVDHGVLNLDSSMKADLSGFAAFYAEREARIKSLRDGFVRIQLNISQDKMEGWKAQIEVEDSGRGFDVTKVNEVANEAAHGRGINMVRGLCQSVRWREPGNRVEAVYAWQVESSTEAAVEADGA